MAPAHSPSFFAIGLSFQKAEESIRGRFSLTEPGYQALLTEAKEKGFSSLMGISTCNRTELFGYANHPMELMQLLCDHTEGELEEFQDYAYIYKNQEAIDHLFRVGTGLDSQILGDFEIIAQLKKSFTKAKKTGTTSPFLERLCNAVIQASKRIKNETALSSGATSVAFASVKYILENVVDVNSKRILLFGTGKIGRNTCDNLIKHAPGAQITLINRTREKAEVIGGKYQVNVKDYGELPAEIRKSDILIVATGAQKPTLSKELIFAKNALLILDLSVPKNVAEDVSEMEKVEVIHLDELSRITDKTRADREKDIPKAEAIYQEVMQDFMAWLETRKFAPVIGALKDKLLQMKEEELDFHARKWPDYNEEQMDKFSERLIQKITKQVANHLKSANGSTDTSIELIQALFQLESTKK